MLSHLDEMRLLRKRARAFLARAVDSLNSGDYDVASFLSEQAVQLHLKSILLEKLGDYPRTHSISSLVSIIKKTAGYEALMRFLEENRMGLRLMEDAYISSRYLVREFAKEEAEMLINIATEVLKHGEVH
jgi:HEPN domain-containing protein